MQVEVSNMAVPINESKASKFYKEIILSYNGEIIPLWGNEDQFLDSLKNSIYEKEDKEYKVDSSQNLKIKFSNEIFLNLFVNNSVIDFDKSIGQRLEFKNYIYIELVESPVVILENRRENSILIRIPRKGCIFINEDKTEDLYYPKEILPFFISQLKERLIEDYHFSWGQDIYTNFSSLFRPMKYILKIKKDCLPLQEKILYKLCINLGLIEHKITPTHKIKIKQDLSDIYIKNTDLFLLSNKKQYNLDSLRFYLSAMENSDPIYQFLEIYHSLESYFYEYLYNHIKRLGPLRSKKEFDQIRESIRDQKMLKLVIKEVSNDFLSIKQKFENIPNFEQFCKDILNRNNIHIEDWEENNMGNFSEKFADFIYSIRNNIVHTKESDKAMGDLSENEKDVLMEVNKTLFFVVKKVFDKNIKW